MYNTFNKKIAKLMEAATFPTKSIGNSKVQDEETKKSIKQKSKKKVGKKPKL